MLPEKLANRLRAYGELDQSQRVTPALTVDEFFNGNEDEGSIGCNLVPHPGILTFEKVCRAVSAAADVSDLRLPVTEFIEGLDWPFVDKIVVICSASPEAVFKRFEEVQPDEYWEASAEEIASFDGIIVPPGHSAVIVWWD